MPAAEHMGASMSYWQAVCCSIQCDGFRQAAPLSLAVQAALLQKQQGQASAAVQPLACSLCACAQGRP